MTEELYKVHRPRTFKEVLGQPEAVKALTGFLKRKAVPQAILFTGPSGCGKTTLARIVRDRMEVGPSDWQEINCADFRGIDMVRDIRSHAGLAPMQGNYRIWLIDECHKLSNDAQNAFLKLLEESPKNAYFFLATTEPGKLLTTVKTRCTEIRTRPLSSKVMENLVSAVAAKEKMPLGGEVIDRIVEVAEGSARKALVLLNFIVGIQGEEEQLNAILASDSKRQAIELARVLMNPKSRWPEVVKVLNGVEGEEEQLRRLVLSYASSVLLGKNFDDRAYLLLCAFESNFFDSGKSGLIRACYQVYADSKSLK
jgi:DNA polymerase-3 subunit gamma/tau